LTGCRLQEDSRLRAVFRPRDYRHLVDCLRLVAFHLRGYLGYRRPAVFLHLGYLDFLLQEACRHQDSLGCLPRVVSRLPGYRCPVAFRCLVDDTAACARVAVDAIPAAEAWVASAAGNMADDILGENRDNTHPTNKDCRSTASLRNKPPCRPSSCASRNNPIRNWSC
jgi:hypothetical protein